MSYADRSFFVVRVSSHKTTSTSLRTSKALKVISLRLPIGVATMYKFDMGQL